MIAAIVSQALVVIGCAANDPREVGSPGAPYDFAGPAASFDLTDELREISGLALLSDGRLAAVQDEDGVVYLLDPESGMVTETVEFGDPGDFEGVEEVGSDLFVVNSGGTLFQISGWSQGRPRTERRDTPLDARCNAEGLGYDRAAGGLLIACKDRSGSQAGDDRSVFRYDPESGSLASEPHIVLRSNDIEMRLHGGNGGSGKLIDKIYKLFGGGSPLPELKPSAVAKHPLTDEVYVLSSSGPMLIVVDIHGEPTNVWVLSREQLPQPEGLAFLENGDLFISTEGTRRPGRLLRYNFDPSRIPAR